MLGFDAQNLPRRQYFDYNTFHSHSPVLWLPPLLASSLLRRRLLPRALSASSLIVFKIHHYAEESASAGTCLNSRFNKAQQTERLLFIDTGAYFRHYLMLDIYCILLRPTALPAPLRRHWRMFYSRISRRRLSRCHSPTPITSEYLLITRRIVIHELLTYYN